MSDGMPSWEEWDRLLTEEQRRYSMFKILSDLYNRDCHHSQDIEKLKNRRIFDTSVSGITGIIGGVLAVIGKKILGISG